MVVRLRDIRTGDLLFFSNNSLKGLGIRFFTSTPWSHIGVAIRRKGDKSISSNYEGDLYVLESTAIDRYDATSYRHRTGFGLTPIEYTLKTRTLSAVRFLREELITNDVIYRCEYFLNQKRGSTFPQHYSPFLSAWLELPFGDTRTDLQKSEFFCSEMVIYFYLEVLNLKNIIDILGPGVPSVPSLISPKHFDSDLSTQAPIFEDEVLLIHRNCDSVISAIWVPIIAIIIISLLIIVIIWYCDSLNTINYSLSNQKIDLINS